MSQTTLLLCLSTSVTDKMIAEKCATYLNEEMAFCHCVCPARVEFHKDTTDVTVKTKFLNETSDEVPYIAEKLVIASRAFLSAYLTALRS